MLYQAPLDWNAPATLIAGRLSPRTFDVRRPQEDVEIHTTSPADIVAARLAIANGREPSDQVIDFVVDRLLNELTW